MKKRSLARRLTYSLIAGIFFLGLCLGLAEIATRLFYHPSLHFQTADLDPELGWRPKADYSIQQTSYSEDGAAFPAHYQTGRDGFREFGDPESDRPKVWFIGDSFTQAVEVSNDRTFYRLLRDSLNFELFAFGQAGYGFLQEFLIFDRYFDLIGPDLVVWQTCDNDFIDNHLELERESAYNPRLYRPYLTAEGTMVWDQSSGLPGWLRRSRFLGLLDRKWHELRLKRALARNQVAESYVPERGRAYDKFDESVKITEQLVRKIAERTPDSVRVVAFSASAYQPQLQEMERIFTEAGLPFFPGPAHAINTAVANGEVARTGDRFHWNELGHRRVAEALQEKLRPYFTEWNDK